MAAQLADKGHPALQTVSADCFGKLIEEINKSERPSAGLVKLIANGKRSLHKA